MPQVAEIFQAKIPLWSFGSRLVRRPYQGEAHQPLEVLRALELNSLVYQPPVMKTMLHPRSVRATRSD